MPFYKLDAQNKVTGRFSIRQSPDDIETQAQGEIGQVYDQATDTFSGTGVRLQEKLDAIDRQAQARIVSGFSSSALGTAHTYKSSPEHQLNLIGLVANGQDSNVYCDDGTGYKEVLHTIAQIQQVLADGKARKQVILAYGRSLKAQARAATTIAELDAIDETQGWP